MLAAILFWFDLKNKIIVALWYFLFLFFNISFFFSTPIFISFPNCCDSTLFPVFKKKILFLYYISISHRLCSIFFPNISPPSFLSFHCGNASSVHHLLLIGRRKKIFSTRKRFLKIFSRCFFFLLCVKQCYLGFILFCINLHHLMVRFHFWINRECEVHDHLRSTLMVKWFGW